MMHAADRNSFRRAFAAATVHDMFNWLTTLVLMPVESVTGYLYHFSGFLVSRIENSGTNKRKAPRLLKAWIEPLTDKIVKVNDTVEKLWASENITIRKESWKIPLVAKEGHMFAQSGWNDRTIGAVVIALAFVTLLIFLFVLVHILKSILKGKMAIWIRRTSKSNLPYCPFMTDYLIILMGAGFTFLVQSSSVFTSTLPPLVSVKALPLERAYCLTLGSNVGTTTTALISALAQTKHFSESLHIALCHLIFNITGILLFYPIPCTRFPIAMSKKLGNITARYRWFALLYVLLLFILLPLLFMGLAFAGYAYVISVALIIAIGFFTIITINSLRVYKRFMPDFLLTWDWLPIWLHSLEPYDKLISKCTCCRRILKLQRKKDENKDPPKVREENSLISVTVTAYDESETGQGEPLEKNVSVSGTSKK